MHVLGDMKYFQLMVSLLLSDKIRIVYSDMNACLHSCRMHVAWVPACFVRKINAWDGISIKFMMTSYTTS